MFLVKEITNEGKQKHTLLLKDGSQVALTLEYKPQQLGWFITNLVRNDLILNNIRIVTSPNLLHQFLNQTDFGIACFTTDNEEPTLLEDFQSGRAKMYILSKEEVAEYERILDGQATA